MFYVDDSDEILFNEYFDWFTKKYSKGDDIITPNTTIHNMNLVAELVCIREEKRMALQSGYFGGLKITNEMRKRFKKDLKNEDKILTFDEYKNGNLKSK